MIQSIVVVWPSLEKCACMVSVVQKCVNAWTILVARARTKIALIKVRSIPFLVFKGRSSSCCMISSQVVAIQLMRRLCRQWWSHVNRSAGHTRSLNTMNQIRRRRLLFSVFIELRSWNVQAVITKQRILASRELSILRALSKVWQAWMLFLQRKQLVC